ncbi:MAG: hypothetical protein WD206_07635 [Actinomycetota bacterium]
MAGVAAFVGVALLAGCTGDRPLREAAASLTPVPTPEASQVRALPVGEVTTAEARRTLCPAPGSAEGGSVPDEGPVPASVREVEQRIADIRGLRFLDPVPVRQLTREEVADATGRELERSAPADYLERKTIVYRTIGVLPEDASLGEALRSFLGGQVAGYYVPETGQLVVVSDGGGGELDALGEATLAHELTHALDDQHFDIGRIASLGARCKDEQAQAMRATVEGSAQHFMTRYVVEHLDLAELGSLALEQQGGSLEDVPPFVVEMQLWSYTAGQGFVTGLAQADGEAAIEDVLRNPPVSTEQVLHPERFPDDAPQQVEVPDLSPALGEGWSDLDVEDVGEAWLATMLGLRLDAADADAAAAGWDGGVARSWGAGQDAVTVLRTVWDTPEDAAAFAGAVRRWLAEAGQAGEVVEEPTGAVSVVFWSPGGAGEERIPTLVASLREWSASARPAATP